MIVVELIYNLSVLVALSVLSGFLNNRVNRTSLIDKILQGLLFGITAIIGMAYPFVLAKGVIFDGRSIVISLCALFFGPLSGLIAAIMAIIYRLILGGAGVLMGTLVIAFSFLTGYFFYNYRKKRLFKNLNSWQFYLFGVIVHSFMLLFVLTLPSKQIIQTYQIVSLTILGIYPLVTILIGKILIDQEQNENFINTLKEREKLYRTTLYSIGDGVITTDETGNIVNMNLIAESLTGWKEKDAKGKLLSEVFKIINEETKLKVENPVERVLKEGTIVGLANHTLLISKKGNKIPIADSAAPIKNSDGKIIGVVLVFRDQTTENEFNKELRERERKFSTLVSNLPGFVYRSALDKDWTMEYISDGCFDITGYKPEDFINNSKIAFNDIIHKGYQKPIWDKWLLVLKDKGTFEYEYPIHTKQNTTRWIWERGKGVYSDDGILLYLEGFITDITAKRIIEDELIESETKLKEAQTIAKFGHFVWDIPTGKWSSSEALNNIFGIDEDYKSDFDGWLNLVHPDDQKMMKNYVEEFFIKNRNQFNKDYRIIRQNDKAVLWVQGVAQLEVDEYQNPIKLFGTIQDITDRKKNEIEVLHEKEKAQNYLDIAEVMLVAINKDQSISMINRKGAEVLGYNENELLGKNWFDLCLPDDARESVKIIFNQIISGLLQPEEYFENFVITKSGEIKIIGWHSNQLRDDSGNIIGFLSSGTDITDQKKLQDELKVNEKKFRSLFEDHSAVKIIIDPDNQNIVDANNAAEEFYGWSINELKKMNISQINTLSQDEIKSEMKKAMLKSRNYYEFKHRKADGSIRDVEVYMSKVIIGGKDYLHSIVHDVTEKKKAEHELLKYELVVKQSPAIIIITDIKGNIEYVNPKFTEVSGYTFDEVIGKNPRILSSGDKTQQDYKEMWNTILNRQEWRGEFYNKKKNGELYWESAMLSPIQNEKGEITNFIAIKEDITERKRLNAELIEAKDKAEEMNRIKSYFFANMSHELRTPFVGIIGFSELLVESLPDPEFKGYAEQILKSAKRLTDTLNKILNITRLEYDKCEPNFTNVDINKLITELAFLFTQAARINNSFIKTNLLFDKHNIKSDKKLLDEILTNLISNAVKFTHNGSIEISVHRVRVDDKNILEIVVSDTGVGIPQNMQEIIWQEFRQASEGYSRSFEGTGLGLSITRKYVDLLGGKISLKSELGIGTVFTIQLPCNVFDIEGINDENSPSKQPKKIKSSEMETKKNKLLYVEDDAVASSFVELVLKSEYEIDTALSAKITLEKVEKNYYDVLMLDINLGSGIDGIELLQEIRKIEYYKNVPVIAVTAYAADKDKDEFLAKGFTHYISKPFHTAELKGLLAEIFN